MGVGLSVCGSDSVGLLGFRARSLGSPDVCRFHGSEREKLVITATITIGWLGVWAAPSFAFAAARLKWSPE
jgi:hypothetical protein